MRYLLAALTVCLAIGATAFSEDRGDSSMNWEPWRYLPVQDGGRAKPLDTLAWETLRTLCNRASFPDPQTGERLSPAAVYLAMLFDWQGSDQAPAAHGGAAMGHRPPQKPDKWDNAPLLRVDYLQLRQAIGMPAGEKYLSPYQLSQAKIRDPHTGGQTPLLSWAEKLRRSDERTLPAFERKAVDLVNNYWAYREHRSGRRLALVPVPGSEHQEWLPAAELLRTEMSDAKDPTGLMRKLKEKFLRVRAAYAANRPEEFNEASSDFLAALAEAGPELGSYPTPAAVGLEVAYNRWAPFRFAWAFTTLAFLCTLLSMGTRWRPFYVAGIASFAAGLLAMLVGFGMRVAISGRAPVTNMYESVVYLGLGTAVFGLLFEIIYRTRYVLAAAAAVSTIALILADNCPAILNPSLRPLQPVLRSNFWLVTHVMSITLSYAAFALALGIGNITLGYFLFRSQNREVIGSLSRFTYKALQVGVLLLAIGTILGGVWADYSWGRFWGWDPKEVWALIALLGYLAVLHARYAGWVRDLGLAALSVICFSLVVMAWYGVNFVLGTGLHSYVDSGGSDGQLYVFGAVAIQLLYVAAAAMPQFPRLGRVRWRSADSESPSTVRAGWPGRMPPVG